jgi:hypothetical protein
VDTEGALLGRPVEESLALEDKMTDEEIRKWQEILTYAILLIPIVYMALIVRRKK